MTNAESFEESVNELVDKLVNEASKSTIVGILQDINEKILKYKSPYLHMKDKIFNYSLVV